VTKILPEENHITAITGSGRLLKDLPEDMPYVRAVDDMVGEIIAGRR
jgi:pilus assembly protein CpaE